MSVLAQPPGQTCSVVNGTGSIPGQNVINVQISCVNTYTVGGNVSGLSGSGLVLQNNGGDDQPIAEDGPFTFPAALDDLSDYVVTVVAQPAGPMQTCTVANGAGSLSGQNVTDVQISCVTDQFTVAGFIIGLAEGSSVVVQNNGGDDRTISADAPNFRFTAQDDGTTFAVTVLAQPTAPNQFCSVRNGSGQIQGEDLAYVLVFCDESYAVGGTVINLNAPGLVIDLNSSSVLLFDKDSDFVFPLTLSTGETWTITIPFAPDGHTCEATPSSGEIGSSDVLDIVIACTTDIEFGDGFETLSETPILID